MSKVKADAGLQCGRCVRGSGTLDPAPAPPPEVLARLRAQWALFFFPQKKKEKKPGLHPTATGRAGGRRPQADGRIPRQFGQAFAEASCSAGMPQALRLNALRPIGGGGISQLRPPGTRVRGACASRPPLCPTPTLPLPRSPVAAPRAHTPDAAAIRSTAPYFPTTPVPSRHHYHHPSSPYCPHAPNHLFATPYFRAGLVVRAGASGQVPRGNHRD